MRILQVLPHLSKGGAERVVVELSNSLIEAGHEVSLLVAFPVNRELNEQYLDKEITVRFSSPKYANRGFAYLKLPFFIVRDWKVLKTYDVIHCHLTFGLIFGSLFSFCRKITRTRNLRLIATCHVVGIGISQTRRIINERLSYLFDVFVLMAQDAKWRRFIDAKKRGNFQFVVNGISANAWMNSLKQPKGKPYWTIGTISRLQAERMPWLFLEVFSHVNDLTNGEVRFILGGDGPEKESLTALSEKLKLGGNLLMPGFIQDPKVILQELDLYIGLNVEGITGIAGLEAVFSGVPIIGIQLDSTYENGATDWIWSHQDPRLIARRIVDYLENPTQLPLLAEQQYRVAKEKFSVESMRDSYLSLYAIKK
jgi:glycosyltransferase involved in cell wall biosynthesis